MTQYGSVSSGICTSYAAAPLSRQLIYDEEDLVPVCPHEKGNRRGYALDPLYKSAPEAALKDPHLYELLALTDAIRSGRARERKLAIDCLQSQLS